MKVLFYAINGIGLGHLNKTILVAKEVRRLRPDWHILFLTNSKFTEVLDAEKFSCIVLPFNESNLLFKPHEKNYISYTDYNKLLIGIVDNYSPKIIIYDWTLPVALVNYAHANGITNLYIMRKDANKYLEAMLKNPILDKIDYLCLPYSKQEFIDLNVGKSIFNLIKKRSVNFVGPIVKSCEKQRRTDKKFKILVSSGGGGWHDSEIFLKFAMRACQKLVSQHEETECRIITGPFYDGKLDYSYANDRFVIEKFNPDFIRILADSDLAITQAGYNMCNEIVMARTPAILVPGHRLAEATSERAKRLERKGVAIALKEYGQIYPTLYKLYRERKLLHQLQKSFSKLKTHLGNSTIAQNAVKLSEDTLYISLNSGLSYNRRLILKNRAGNYKNLVFEGDKLPQHFFMLLQLARESNYKVIQIRSNDKSFSNTRFVAKAINSGANSFMIDFYGPNGRIHNLIRKKKREFSSLVKFIKILNPYKLHLVANYNINLHNYRHIPIMARLLIKLGVFQIQLVFARDKGFDVHKQIIALRKVQLTGLNKFRWIYFSNSRNNPEALNMERFYAALIMHYSKHIQIINEKINAALAERKLTGVLSEYDKNINSLKSMLAQKYADNNAIEERLEMAVSNKYSFVGRPLRSRLAAYNRALSMLLNKRTATMNLIADQNMKSKLISINADQSGSSPQKHFGIKKEKMKILSYLRVLNRRLSEINAALFRIQILKYKLLKDPNQLRIVSKFERKERLLNKALNAHYRQKVKPIKERISSVLHDREYALKNYGVYSSVLYLQGQKEKYERELAFVNNLCRQIAA